MESPTKESLLTEIEALIAYGAQEPTIHPDLLTYLEVHDLIGIRDKLKSRANILTEEDKKWLEQFKKYD